MLLSGFYTVNINGRKEPYILFKTAKSLLLPIKLVEGILKSKIKMILKIKFLYDELWKYFS